MLARVTRLLGILLAALLASCEQGPSDVTLSQLVARQEAYDGRQIRVHGDVVRLQDLAGPYYYVLEDAQQNDAELQPTTAADGYAGRPVTVTGTFHFTDRTGRRIAVETIEPSSA